MRLIYIIDSIFRNICNKGCNFWNCNLKKYFGTRDEYQNLICWHIDFWIVAGNKNVVQWFHSSFSVLRTYWIRVLKQKEKMRMNKILTGKCQTQELRIKFDPRLIFFWIVPFRKFISILLLSTIFICRDNLYIIILEISTTLW